MKPKKNITQKYLIIHFIMIFIIPYVFIWLCGFLSEMYVQLNKYSHIIFFVSLIILISLMIRWIYIFFLYRSQKNLSNEL